MNKLFVHTILSALLAVMGIGFAVAQDAPAPSGPQRPARIDPDYAGIVIPPNIAPLNFTVLEPGKTFYAKLSSQVGAPVEVSSKTPDIVFPADEWKALIEANAGQAVELEIAAKQADGEWVRYAPITNTIANEPVDSHLVYRKMRPWYVTYDTLGIFQRNLETFEETAIIENEVGGEKICVNCHSFANNQPEPMTIQMRFPFIMLMADDGKLTSRDTRTEFNKAPFAYTTLHPSGRKAVYSFNKILQLFHTVGETRDIYDFASDLLLYNFETNTVSSSPKIASPDRLETFPTWSPDGRYLYFCTTKTNPTGTFEDYKQVRYDLVRIAFDEATETWGEIETVLTAEECDRSIAMPRISPDGRYVLFCMCEYGTFPVFQESSDLYLLDLETGDYKRLACNSGKSESWHTWSANGRWIVFSSKRRDGLLAKPHFSYIDEAGNASKAFVLPQEDPRFYDSFVMTYSVPEFVQGAVNISKRDVDRLVRSAEDAVKVKLDPKTLEHALPDTDVDIPSAYAKP